MGGGLGGFYVLTGSGEMDEEGDTLFAVFLNLGLFLCGVKCKLYSIGMRENVLWTADTF